METKLGLGNGTIGKWGKNGRVPNYSNLNAVCSELGVSVEDIMRDDDVVPTSNKNAENAKKAHDPKIEGLSADELRNLVQKTNDRDVLLMVLDEVNKKLQELR